jgi:hypothetical protein
MKCIMCNEEIEIDNMTSALSLGNYPPVTIKEILVHIKCPHYHGWKFYGGLTMRAVDPPSAPSSEGDSNESAGT